MGMLRRVGANPVALLVVAVALLTAMIQSGELGTADTTRRLEVTHSLWDIERAAGWRRQIIRIWDSGARWADVCVVRHWAVAADAARGYCGHGRSACTVVA